MKEYRQLLWIYKWSIIIIIYYYQGLCDKNRAQMIKKPVWTWIKHGYCVRHTPILNVNLLDSHSCDPWWRMTSWLPTSGPQVSTSWVNMHRRSSGRCRRRRPRSTSPRPGGSSTSRATRGPATWPVTHGNQSTLGHSGCLLFVCHVITKRLVVCLQCCPCCRRWRRPSSLSWTPKVWRLSSGPSEWN